MMRLVIMPAMEINNNNGQLFVRIKRPSSQGEDTTWLMTYIKF